MNPRIDEELQLLRTWFGERLRYHPEGHWVKIDAYCLDPRLWSPAQVEVAFQMPEGLPAQAPYAFHVRPGVTVIGNGAAPSNYTYPTSNPWGDGWGTFSWQLEVWTPGARAHDGSNTLDFARSIAKRFRQGA